VSEAIAVDRTVVDEYLLSIFHVDKAVAFLGTKPLTIPLDISPETSMP
jgi:hypothetical protein